MVYLKRFFVEIHLEKDTRVICPWELYNLRKDWTQAEDVAAKHRAKLKELQNLFWKEAKKYRVLPLYSSVATRLITPRPSITTGRNVFIWTRPLTGMPNGDGCVNEQ